MRIVAGAWRGRRLLAPAGAGTRPTADRVRQALFDRLRHAPWAGPATLDGAVVLDVFAGTGALGLEALSRGAASATFLETDRAALQALRHNAQLAPDRATILAADARHPPPGHPCTLIFLDPPYGAALLAPALAALARAGWLAPDALILAETGPADPSPAPDALATWTHGPATLTAWRHHPPTGSG